MQNLKFVVPPTGIEPVFQPWKGRVLTARRWGLFSCFNSSPFIITRVLLRCKYFFDHFKKNLRHFLKPHVPHCFILLSRSPIPGIYQKLTSRIPIAPRILPLNERLHSSFSKALSWLHTDNKERPTLKLFDCVSKPHLCVQPQITAAAFCTPLAQSVSKVSNDKGSHENCCS